MTSLNTDYVRIGLITNTHGVRGELAVMPLTDDAGRFKRLSQVFIENASVVGAKPGAGPADVNVSRFDIEQVRFHKNKLLLKFKGYDDVNGVVCLKGLYIAIEEKDLVELPENSYFIFDLLGCEVTNLSGVYLGVVTDVLSTGAADIYVVKKLPGNDSGNRGNDGMDSGELLIPAVKSVIKEVSVKDKRIIADVKPADYMYSDSNRKKE